MSDKIDFKTITQAAGSLLLAIVMAWASFLHQSLGKQEERIYALQKDMVSEAKLNALESRFNARLENEISNVRREQETTNKYLILIIRSLKEQGTMQ